MPSIKPMPCFHLLVEAKYSKQYCLHLLIPLQSSLSELDNFLRNIWLECCGHISQFNINDITYIIIVTNLKKGIGKWEKEGKNILFQTPQ